MSAGADHSDQDPTPVGLLDAVRATKQAEMAAQVEQLRLVVEWCAAHEVDASETATHVEFGRDTGLGLAGEGAPYVSEFAVVELAAALGMTTDAGRRYVGKVLEVRYRLPGFWEEVVSGRLPWWRAARVAEHTHALPAAGARLVDQRLASTAAKVTFGQVERLTAEALARYAPEEAEAKHRQALENRHVNILTHDVGPDGVVQISGGLDLADGLDLDTALDHGAAELKALGCTESRDVRRSLALGALARRQTQLNLNPEDPDGKSGPLVKPRQTVVHVHTHDQHLARCENTRAPITVDQVREWCTHPDTELVITEVIDTTEHLHIDRYERDDRLWNQAIERDLTCVFPFCTRPAASCDCDHVFPYARGGPTCSCNTAPACRGHHRAKTHGGWTSLALDSAHYLWRSPNGLWWHRGPDGTRDLGHLTPD
jgi:hypothetical protein